MAKQTDDAEEIQPTSSAYGSGVRDLYSQGGGRSHALGALGARGPVLREAAGVMTTTREAAEEVFRHPELFTSESPPSPTIGRAWRPLIPIQYAPPEHKLYRRLFDPMFAPRAINPLVPTIQRLVNEDIDALDA